MPLARSFLYVPANREKFLEKALGLPADAFIFDLEDSVPPAEKTNDGDLNTDLGCVWSLDGPEMLHARQQTLLATRAARFDTPLDGVYANVRDPGGFERDTALSRRLGYRGRKLIHPSQIEPCNRLYAPSAQELDYYARVLEAFDKAGQQGSA